MEKIYLVIFLTPGIFLYSYVDIIYNKDIPFEISTFIIDPITAVGMFDTVKKKKSNSVVISGTSTTLGKMFYKLCFTNKIQVINIVKNETENKNLKDIYEMSIQAMNVIKLSDSEWENEVKKLCDQLNSRIGFDLIGGQMTGKLFHLMPENSHLYHLVVSMENEIGKLQTDDFVFKDKTISGWWFITWIRSLSEQEINYWWNFLKNEIENFSKIFGTHISKEFPLNDIIKAIHYYKNNINEGRVLIRPFNTSL